MSTHLGDVGRETNSAAPLSTGVLRPGHEFVDILEQLALVGAGVTTQQDVQLRPEIATAGLAEVLPGTTKQLKNTKSINYFSQSSQIYVPEVEFPF